MRKSTRLSESVMRPGDESELLSAYLDREVTPAERAAVESHLDASPDARAELDALAELSLCLRTLDRPAAPADMQASVMRAIAGRSVAPVAAAPTAAPVRRHHRREWLVTVAAVASTAAGILLAVTSWNPKTPQMASTATRPLATEYTLPSVAANPGAESEGLHRFAIDERTRYRAVGDAAFREDRARLGSSAVMGGLTASSPAMPRPAAPAAVKLEALSEPADMQDMEQSAGKSLDKVALNQFLEMWAATDAPDRYVANIDLQVLDVKQSANSFQVLLVQNGVVTLENRAATEAKSAAGSPVRSDPSAAQTNNKPSTQNDDGSMIAVYVDTTADRVTKSLEELAKRHDVLGVRLHPPLALARLAEDNIEPRAEVVSESLLRAELDDVTSAYATNQQLAWQDNLDEEAPVDALAVLPFAKKLQDENGRLKQRAVERSVMRQQQARTLNMKDNNATANALTLGNTFNYSSVVKLPIANGFDTTLDVATGNNTVLNVKPEPPLAVAQRRGNAAQNEYGTNSALAGRQRNTFNQAAANPVRLLVVFQDPVEEPKAKAALP